MVTFAVVGCLLGGLSVALGAFGSHGLRRRASLELMATFETGVRYQMFHSLALLFLAVFPAEGRAALLQSFAGWLFIAGIFLFSGSLYLLVLTGLRRFGAVTPLGGLAFIAGWLLFAMAFLLG